VRITVNTDTQIGLRLPDVGKKGVGKIFTDAETGGKKQVGNLSGVAFRGGPTDPTIVVLGEILAIRPSGIVFVVGFAAGPPIPVPIPKS
jgi:hypothetical protein